MFNHVAPCFNCDDRTTECHSDCETYCEWRTELAKVKAKRKAFLDKEYEMNGIEVRRTNFRKYR